MAETIDIIEQAICFATKAHMGAKRKGCGLPYIVHPMEAMTIVASMTSDKEVIAAAALHDVVEDTAYTIEDIRENFGERVAMLVAHETENKRPDLPKADTWKIRKQEQMEQAVDAPIEAKMIMLADKLSNLRASLRDYRMNGNDIWQKFNMKDGKEQEWYYRKVAEILSELRDTASYQEYVSIIEEIFSKE